MFLFLFMLSSNWHSCENEDWAHWAEKNCPWKRRLFVTRMKHNELHSTNYCQWMKVKMRCRSRLISVAWKQYKVYMFLKSLISLFVYPAVTWWRLWWTQTSMTSSSARPCRMSTSSFFYIRSWEGSKWVHSVLIAFFSVKWGNLRPSKVQCCWFMTPGPKGVSPVVKGGTHSGWKQNV